MSEAPRLMASSSTLLTKRTTGVSSALASRVVVAVVVAADGLEVLQALVVAHAVAHAVAGVLGEFDGLAQLVLVHEDRLDRAVGGELDLVQGRGVGRVGDGHEQPVAALEQRQHLVFLGELLADELGGRLVQVQAATSNSGMPNSTALAPATALPLTSFFSSRYW